MKKILLRAGKSPLISLKPEQTAAARESGVFVGNVGNSLFFDAAYKHLSLDSKQEVTPDFFLTQGVNDKNAMAERINAEFDHFVLPMADNLRDPYIKRMEILTELINKLKIPVTLLSICIKCRLNESLDDVSDDLKKASTNFIKAILDHSPSVGVRGEFTQDFLLKLGFSSDQIKIIGCPSLATFPDTKIEKKDLKIQKLGLNYHPFNIGTAKMELFLKNTLAKFPDLTYITQNVSELRLLLWGTGFDNFEFRGMDSLNHPLYQNGNARFYTESRKWIAEMGKLDFVFGPRTHGAFAALLAGTPAQSIAWDFRGLELYNFHKIPHILYNKLDPEKIDLQKQYDELDFSEFNKYIPINQKIYADFLTEQGLEFDLKNESFEEKMAEVFPVFAEPIKPMPANTDFEKQVLARLNWLYQGPQTDTRDRREANYKNPWDGAVGNFPAPDMMWKTRAEIAEGRIQNLENRLNNLPSQKAKRLVKRILGK